MEIIIIDVRSLIADALAPLGIAVMGAIPRDDKMVLPERHLGLVQASEHSDLTARLSHFADIAERQPCPRRVHVPITVVLDGVRSSADAIGRLWDGARLVVTQ